MLIPYVDTTLYPLIDFSSIPHTDGVCLGFVVADASKDPSWGGAHKVSSDFMDKRINGFKKKLVCSFGGAQGKELAQVCDDEFELFENINKWSSGMISRRWILILKARCWRIQKQMIEDVKL